MRHYFKYSIVFVLGMVIVLFTSCQNNHSGSSKLNLAESLMNTQPDSALKILKQMKNPENLSKKQQATYYLLLTYVQDKNYITPKSDSFINIAVDYFDKHNDQHKKMLAYYCKGRVNSELGDALQAQEYYLKALEASENSNDHVLLSKIYNFLGRIYAYQNLNELAISMYKKSLNILQQNNDSTNMSFALRNTARIYTQINKTDSAILYYKEAIKCSTPQSLPSLFNDLACLYINQKQYKEASNYLDKALLATNKPSSAAPIYTSLGRLFQETSQLDSAEYYLNKALESNNQYTQTTCLYYLSEIEKEKKNYKKALDYLEQSNEIRNLLRENSNNENIRRVQSMFNYQRIAKDKSRFEKEADQRMIAIYQVTIFFVFILVSCFLIFKKEQNKKKLLLELREQQYKQSQRYIEDNTIQIQKLEQDLSSEIEQFSDVQKQLFEARKLILEMENRQVILKQGTMHLLEKDFKTATLYLKAHSEDSHFTDSEWSELRLLIDATYSDLTQRLMKLYPRVSQEELRICYLIKMEVPVKKIAFIMNLSSSAISQKKRRLYKKFTEESENAEKFDSLIAEL